MGYNIQIVKSDALIPADHLEDCYHKMCALNETHDHEKRGGSWSNGKQNSKWFSYYNKMGQEDIFMKAIENDAVGSIKWHGEDGKEWTTQFFGSNVIDDQPVPKKIGMKKWS